MREYEKIVNYNAVILLRISLFHAKRWRCDHRCFFKTNIASQRFAVQTFTIFSIDLCPKEYWHLRALVLNFCFCILFAWY